ncbi:DUF134 domain-containing protein [Desulfonema magnum]|uniref:UPF0251 protein dnm_053920 n=1 Tax=Desulfonema magnum TaxID=45655 RepID=A0A975BQ06_9BACT|nr:DUF134 domain-containing protein [Desulfonema magnum]QTA89342.1 DUF134 [Desulfonema magnum]
MVRPKKNRIVAFNPEISYFKPRGIPMVELEEVHLTVDEREAIRLSDLLGMPYEEAGREMGISRATFGRIIQHARKIVADALINGKAINIEGGNYTIADEMRIFICEKCNHKWVEAWGTGRPQKCPSCNHEYFQRVPEKKTAQT